MSIVTEGSEGWVFLTGGSNNVIDTFNGFYSISDWREKWAELLTKRNKKINALGAKYIHINAPEKISIYSRYLDNPSVNISNSPSSQLNAILNGHEFYIDPSTYLREQSFKYKVYHKTDSHWNFIGALSAYQLIMHRLGLPQKENILENYAENSQCVMDLGAKVDPVVEENVYFHELTENVKYSWKNELVLYTEKSSLDNDTGLHQGSSVLFKNSNPHIDKRVVVFGDSFSEYRPHLLTAILAETFSEVLFIWSLSLDFDLIKKFGPDICISESAERFMPHYVPDDKFDSIEYIQKKLSSLGVID